MNLLKTDKVFFIGLATTATVKDQKKKKKKKHSEKDNDTKQHKKQTKYKTNCKVTIYQDRYILPPNTGSFGG